MIKPHEPTPSAKRVIADALRLKPRDRADLVDRLLVSLDSDIEEDVESAWDAEIARRLKEVESGAVKPIPWDEARKRIFAKPRKKR